MIFIVQFEDNPDRAAARAAHMQDHLSFLERNAGAVRAAGPLADAGDGTPVGGMWLVEAADRADVQALVEADPFWPTGLRKSVRILRWNQVFADGKRRI
jgi:uncharacterized protein